MEYEIGDIVEIEDTIVGIKLVRIFEIFTIEDSIFEDTIGFKKYKGASIEKGDSGFIPFEFFRCQVKEVYRKLDRDESK